MTPFVLSVAAAASGLGLLWAVHRLTVVRRVQSAVGLRADRGVGARRGRGPGTARAGPGRAGAAARPVLRHERRRREAIERQLPDVLALQAAALRAGHSVGDSLAAAGREAGPPIGPELEHLGAELELGAGLEQALRELAGRCRTPYVQPWIAAMLAGQATGGDLTRSLTSLAERARRRMQLRSEVKALTAQGRLSGTVVALAPLGFLLLMSAASGREALALYGTKAGVALLVAGAVLDAAGLFWIRRIVAVRL